MNLKTISALILFLSLSALSVAAQEPTCALKLDQWPVAPELHGFRLGMTTDQVKTRVPPVVFGRTNQFGLSKTSINPDFDPKFDKASFEGVRTVSFSFLDGRLMELWLGYDSSFKWQKLDGFIAGFSKAMNVPATWQVKGRGQQITCQGIQLFASMVAGSPSIRITDTTGEQVLTSRMEEAANAEEEAETAQPIIIGDKHAKLYYPPDCPGANDVSVANRMEFKSIDEAQKAGYKPAKCE
ncbi:MAG: hypothetical protein ABI923_05435 [bacterium]